MSNYSSTMSSSDAEVPTMMQCLCEAFVPALCAVIVLRILYPNVGHIVDMFCCYICMMLFLLFIVFGLVHIAYYMWTKITIRDGPISRTRMDHMSKTGAHMSKTGEHSARDKPRIRHNAKVGGSSQFRGRRDLCGAVTVREGQ